ncbi:MAG TPA: formimidoyltetrahydrofolate cyclodeaminase [Kosmotogaceae bacterium]|nr:MAG: Methenyl tetrahydrofolate cyclohydrolase [Thermotogales bacterium 46_20]HAA85770.1 formimidoyltetrahydrofolate cyclodeaminase [Kosmotogaceae bacterium]
MDFCSITVKEFLEKIAEKSPTPGGGAVGAIAAALGAALGAMVSNLTIGKKGYEDVEGHMETALEVFEAEMNYLCELANKDIQAFDQVMASYKLSKGTEEEKNARHMKIQQALKTAIEVPFDLARRTKNIIVSLERLAKWGNLNTISDVEASAYLLVAAYRIARSNVAINLKNLEDPAYAKWVTEEMQSLERQIMASYDRIMEVIGKRNA